MAEVQSVQALASSLPSTIPSEFVRFEAEQPAFGALEVPVIDMSLMDSCGARVVEAAREWGLFQVVNHGVPSEAVEELQRVGREFFALPPVEKERYAMDFQSSGRLEGYGSKLLQGNKTWTDFFYQILAPPAMVNHDAWPMSLQGYREANEDYCGHMQRLSRDLFEHLSAGLGLEKGAMLEAFGGDDLMLVQKINFYPPCPKPELTLGLAPHTDLSTLTVLVSNQVQGLQISRDGHWYDVNYVPHALVIHIGDQIEILSNGRYKAVLHRSTVSKEKTRISWPVFLEPPADQVVGPHPQLVTGETLAKYKPKRFEDYRYCKINKLPQ